MEAILKVVEEPYRLLFQLLAGCGPMRAGEALGLEIDKHISKDFHTLYIRQKAIRGKIEHFTKTESGTELECEDGEIIGRNIDLSKDLTARLRAFVGQRRSGLPSIIGIKQQAWELTPTYCTLAILAARDRSALGRIRVSAHTAPTIWLAM